jgi:SAM-dependent methyltransferase
MKELKYKTENDWTDEVIQRFWDFKVTENHPYFTEEVGIGLIKLLKQHIALKGDILDYGCGNGVLINYLSKDNNKNNIYGLDFSKESVEQAIRKNKNNINVIKIINFSELNENFTENSFDVIFLIETIEHLRSDILKNTLDSIYKLLKPNGYIFVTTPFNEDLKSNSIYCPFCDAMHHHMQHIQSFTINRLTSILEEHKFSIRIVSNTDFLYYQNKLAYYKIHIKWWIKLKLGLSKRLPFQKKHLYGIAQKLKRDI